MKQKLILLTLVFGLTIVSQSTLSLGMGNIQVYSSLDEQLQSTIELVISPEEDLQNLTVKLATSDDYKKVGLDRSFVPSNIMVSLNPDDPSIINVTSNGPISEPIISLLLDVNWNNGRILREFTILLDPPVYDTASNNVQVDSFAVDSIKDDVIEEPIANTEPELEERDSQQDTYTNEDLAQYDRPDDTDSVAEDTSSYNSGAEVIVNEGDTLWRIANNNKLGGLSANQMMMAIYNNNPTAFIDNNINMVIKGSRLVMPTLDQAEAISYAEALAQVESHHQSWAPDQQDYSSYQTTDDYSDDTTDTSSSLDYGVQLSGGDSDGSDSGQTNAEVGDNDQAQLSAEDQYNQESEQAELKDRISELEDIVEQQQAVIEIDDDSLANLESQLDETADMTDDSTESMVDDSLAVADDVWDTDVDSTDDMTDDGLSIDVTTDDSAMTDDEMVDSVDEDTITDNVDTTASSEPVKQETAPPKFSGATESEESIVDKSINFIMDNLMWVLIGLGGLILLLVIPKLLNRSDDDEDETSFLDDIKQRNKETDEDPFDDDDSTDTKMNQALELEEDEDSEEIDGESEDVLAELDKSIAFEDDDVDPFEDTSLDESDDDDVFESHSDDDDGFDLDGFLNDDMDSSDSSITADHSETLAGADFSDQEEDSEAEDSEAEDAETEDDDVDFEDVSFDDLDLDLDDDSDTEEETDTSEDSADDETEEVDLDDEFEDFDLDDLGMEVELDEEPEVEVAKDESNDEPVEDVDFDDDFDFELDDELQESAEETDSGDDNLEGSSDDDDFDDLLDLSEDEETFETQGDDEDDEIDLGLDSLMDDGDAIDTKLDLAKAYLEMGDVEGAKNLLNEVVSEGTSSQVDDAKKILDDM